VSTTRSWALPPIGDSLSPRSRFRIAAPMRLRLALSLCAIALAFCAFFRAAAAGEPYRYFRIGSASDAHPSGVRAGFALLGGGKDLDEAFGWLCGLSNGGDFLILRATGTDAYNPYVNSLCRQNSVATLVIPNREAATDPFVAQAIRNAEAIFVAGGDQSNYINFWRGTPVQSALNDAIARGVPIGGTSAGLAILGEFVYSAQGDTPGGPNLSSRAALENPFDTQVTIVRDYLKIPVLRGAITDTHFSARDHLGRLLVFMARILESGDAKTIRAIGVDQQTAVLVSADGQGSVAGIGAAYFFSANRKPTICAPGTPLTFSGISVTKIIGGGNFDVEKWSGAGIFYSLSVDAGTVHSTRTDGAIY
jgi:cyanophycinase